MEVRRNHSIHPAPSGQQNAQLKVAAWPRWPEAGVPSGLCGKEYWDPLAMPALDSCRNCRLWGQLLRNTDPKGTQQCHWDEPVEWLNVVGLTAPPEQTAP